MDAEMFPGLRFSAALHLQTFAFLFILVAVAVNMALRVPQGMSVNPLGLLLPVYIFFFLRRIGGESRRRTVFKVIFFGLGSLVAVMLAMMFTLAVTAVGT